MAYLWAIAIALSSPRSWGCFHVSARSCRDARVFPTLVGVFLGDQRHQPALRGLPHARGGVSHGCTSSCRIQRSSPRSWGCFRYRGTHRLRYRVFPTLVGVFLSLRAAFPSSGRLPHARGGVSGSFQKAIRMVRSSPRSWGCFPVLRRLRQRTRVFPTLVGVFLERGLFSDLVAGLPHARGGVSWVEIRPLLRMTSSPRSWGCFRSGQWATMPGSVFPTLVGVFPSAG